MKKIAIGLIGFLISLSAQAQDCSVDSAFFFWDIEIATSPRLDGISDHANEEMEAELRQIFQKKGYKLSSDQRAQAGTYQNDNDYRSAGRYLLISGRVEGSGDVEVLLDLSIFRDGASGIGKIISGLRKTLAQLDQRLLDSGEDFAQATDIKIPGAIFLGGAKERFFFGIGQSNAERAVLSQIPACQSSQ